MNEAQRKYMERKKKQKAFIPQLAKTFQRWVREDPPEVAALKDRNKRHIQALKRSGTMSRVKKSKTGGKRAKVFRGGLPELGKHR